MPVTVRYLLDWTCNSAFGCTHIDTYAILGRAPTFMHTHLDAPPMLDTGGGGLGYLCSLRTADGSTPGSIFIQANVPVGATDATGSSTLVIDTAATTIHIESFAMGNATTPIHFTGYVDITYGDRGPYQCLEQYTYGALEGFTYGQMEQCVQAISASLVTIVG